MKSRSGQATVEAAVALPVVMLGVLLLLQPGIILYDRMVMRGAAAEGCRVLVTTPADQTSSCQEYILRRLGSVPSQDLFHVHGATCSWEVQLEGGDASASVAVTISNKLKPLPLIGAGAQLLGMLDEEGCFTVTVQEECAAQPSWAVESQGGKSSSEWVGAWFNE